jgi:methionyl-tRNA synthetase
MGEVLAVLGEIIRQIAILVQPVMPESAAKILDQLGVDLVQRDFSFLDGKARLASGQGITKPEPVFPRFVDKG